MIVRSTYPFPPITVPDFVHTLDGFRRWVVSDDFPDTGHVSFFQGEIFIDMSPERLESHNQVKTEVGGVLGPLAKSLDLGKYFTDGLWLTNDNAELSTEPDGTFASWETLKMGRARVVPRKEGDLDGLEMRGSPDWVMEVVSDTTVRKDTEILPKRYHVAGITEFWLIDARGEEIEFTVYHRHPHGYEPASAAGGWWDSGVFGRSFRLSRARDQVGGWQYTLQVKD